MNKFFLYARKSTDDEERQILSIEAQITELRAFAQREGLAVIDELIEKQSAKTPGRPIFNEMLDRIESNEATGILAWHPDRLARNSVDGGRIVHLLDTEKLCALKFPQFWYENTAQGKFMLAIAFGQSKYYIDSLAENTKRGLRQKVRRGEYPSLAPIGYLNDTRSKTIIVDKHRAPIILRAFELYAEGHSRLEDISNFLAQHGITTRLGNRLHRDRISYILTNPFYYGHFRYSGEVHEGNHQPLVSKKLFDMAQEIQKRRCHPQKPKKIPPQLCGLISCASCGMMITGEHHTKRQKNGNVHHYTYYRCTKKHKITKCPEPFISEQDLARQLSSLLDEVSLKADWAAQLRQMLAEDKQKSAQAVTAFVQDARQKIRALDQTLQRLLDGYLAQDIEREEYRARKAALMADKKSLQEQIGRLTQKQTGWLEPLAQWIIAAENLSNVATGSDLLAKKAAAQKVFGSNLFLTKRVLQLGARSARDFSEKSPWAALRAANPRQQKDSLCLTMAPHSVGPTNQVLRSGAKLQLVLSPEALPDRGVARGLRARPNNATPLSGRTRAAKPRRAFGLHARENHRVSRGPITAEHLAGLPGLRHTARDALIARQPKTVLEALSIPDVGRKATKHLLAAGLVADPERVQTRTLAEATRPHRR